MFGRLDKFLSKHFEAVGLVLIVTSLFWLMSVGAEETLNVYGPVFPFIVKTSLGLALMAAGAIVLLGGEPDEK